MAELADAAAEHAGEQTVQEYITHHLSFLTETTRAIWASPTRPKRRPIWVSGQST